MRQVKLTDKDLQEIKDLTHSLWIGRVIKSTSADTYVSECYVNAFLIFCNKYGYVVQDGKIYVKESSSE